MNCYLVGGAVRDKLLGYPYSERDWVVVGSTAEDMLAAGFKQVGKDFPVFLHPETNEEYALARTERKTGKGYTGFTCEAGADVTLEQDLARRDLTINAIAEDANGQIVDPYQGREDLENKVLRHVSPAFVEDPVRVLRVARFAARYAHLGFRVAEETLALIRRMAASGELEHLVPERVWQELQRALGERRPDYFFKVLEQGHAMAAVFPQLARQMSQSALDTLRAAARGNYPDPVRFAVLVHNLSPEALKQLCSRLKVPNAYRTLAQLVVKHSGAMALPRSPEQLPPEQTSPEQTLKILEDTDAFRRAERFEQFLQCCELISGSPRGARALQQAFERARTVDTQSLIAQGFTGPELGRAIREQRLEAIAAGSTL